MAKMEDKELVSGLRKRAGNPLVDASTSQYLTLAAERLATLTGAGRNRRRMDGPRRRRQAEPDTSLDHLSEDLDDYPAVDDWDNLTSPFD